MNNFVTFACLLAVVGLSQGSAIGGYGYGLGGYNSVPILSSYIAPAAVSTAHVYKAPPIPVVRVISAPIIKSVVPVSIPLNYGLGLGKSLYGGYGWGYGGYGLGKGLYGGYGLGYGGYGLGYGYGGHHI